MEHKAKAGVAIVDITPPAGLELAGYPHYPRRNTGAHDPLYASCLYLAGGKGAAAIVNLDLLFFSRRHVLEVRRRAAGLTGLAEESILIGTSHTHSAPWASGRLDMEALLEGRGQDEAYIEELIQKVSGCVASAVRTAFPARVGFYKEHCGREENIGGNRRDPVNGVCDPGVYTLVVRDEENTVRGIWVQYALHPTLLHEDSDVCSADYTGYIRRYLAVEYPHAVMVFSQGASGDQSTRHFREGQSFGEAKRYGDALGAAAARAVEKAQPVDMGRVAVRAAPFDPPLRQLPSKVEAEAHLQKRKAELAELEAAGATYAEKQSAYVNLLGAEDILGYVLLAERGLPMELAVDELPGEIALLCLGELRLAFVPGEVFQGVITQLRAETGLPGLMVQTNSNGCLPGYVYTREDAALGGYEVDTSLLREDTDTLMRRTVQELLREG